MTLQEALIAARVGPVDHDYSQLMQAAAFLANVITEGYVEPVDAPPATKNYECRLCRNLVQSRYPVSCKKCLGMPMMKPTRKVIK